MLFAIFAAGMLVPAISGAQSADPLIKQEYFIQQSVDEDLLITINAFEAELDGQVRRGKYVAKLVGEAH